MILESRYQMLDAVKTSTLTTTATKGAVQSFGEPLNTPEGKEILGTGMKLIRTRMRVVLSISADFALAASSTVSLKVFTDEDGAAECETEIATFGPYSASDKGKILSYELPNDKIEGAVQLGLEASAAQSTGGAGSISAILLSKLD